MGKPDLSMNAPGPRRSALKEALRAVIPRRLLAERGIIRRLGGRAGRTYLKLRVLEWAGMRASNMCRAPQESRSFLFVCYGNIMRSPMAEQMFKRALADRAVAGAQVGSAGIHAIAGSEAHPRARLAARELALPLDDHRSRLLTPSMVEHADAIFAMDFQNKAELLELFPQAKHKIFMLGAYADGAKRCEIPDPFFGDQNAARRCYRVLQNCIDNLAESLWPRRTQGAGEAVRSQTAATQI